MYYYTILITNRAVPGTVWNWRAGLGLGRLDRDDLELARELGLLVEDAREQLAGILVRGRVPRSEGLVGLVDDVVEGGHLVLCLWGGKRGTLAGTEHEFLHGALFALFPSWISCGSLGCVHFYM